MIAVLICVLACAASYWAGKRSLGLGMIALLAFGYFYGILRANLLTVFSHFIFDAGMLGLYLSQKWSVHDPADARRSRMIRLWTMLLIAWPFVIALLPFQPIMVTIVGLRGNIFFIPVLILGSQLKEKDLVQLSAGLAVLNVTAAGFAFAEYSLGVPRFFPFSPVTSTIYASGDIAGGFFRIPAIFSSAAAYGGSMVASLPYVIGFWTRAQRRILRLLALAGIGAALLGILMSATRLNFVLGSAMIVATLVTNRVKASKWVAFLVLIAAMGYVAMTNERFQRFKTLSDTEYLADRVAGSVNRGFWEILTDYPMGNGMGGGGTSLPYFLQGQVRNPIGQENEYSRILCEQGIIGLLLWVAFIGWFLLQARTAFAKGSWQNSRRLVWSFAAVTLGTAWIGTGLLAAIPMTFMMLLGIGWTTTPMPAEVRPVRHPEKKGSTVVRRYGLVHS